MSERKLKLVKGENGPGDKGSETRKRILLPPHSAALKNRRAPMEIENPSEAAEAARFKALTEARAARQAMIRRIMAELLDIDSIPPAA